jgi:hypothetical protein
MKASPLMNNQHYLSNLNFHAMKLNLDICLKIQPGESFYDRELCLLPSNLRAIRYSSMFASPPSTPMKELVAMIESSDYLFEVDLLGAGT